MTSHQSSHRSGDEEISEGETGEQAYGLGRILALSDGVFAFSLTLLVVTLAVPTAGSSASLARQLLDQVPNYFSSSSASRRSPRSGMGTTKPSNTFAATTAD